MMIRLGIVTLITLTLSFLAAAAVVFAQTSTPTSTPIPTTSPTTTVSPSPTRTVSPTPTTTPRTTVPGGAPATGMGAE